MRVPVYTPIAEPISPTPPSPTDTKHATSMRTATTGLSDGETLGVEYINMATGLFVTILGWLIWVFIAGLNVYLIAMLAKGRR